MINFFKSRLIKDPVPNFDWESLSFSLTKTEKMTLSILRSKDETKVWLFLVWNSHKVCLISFLKWEKAQLLDYGPLPLEPSATVLNYGQGIFEGLKGLILNFTWETFLLFNKHWLEIWWFQLFERFQDVLQSFVQIKMLNDFMRVQKGFFFKKNKKSTKK
jgi:hypothetical protein